MAAPRSPTGPAPDGRLADNIAYFGRVLRAAGLAVGPGRILDAIAAVEAAGLGGREDLYWILHATLVSRHEDDLVFDQAFRLFFRRRGHEEKLIALLSPMAERLAPEKRENLLKRVEEALFAGVAQEHEREPTELEVQARLAASSEDVLRTKDFAQMGAEEIAEARRRIAALTLPDDLTRARRFRSDARGRSLDPRASLRAALATGGELIPLRRRGPKWEVTPVVALVDISGSMAEYSRPILSFLHALTERRRKVSTFLFGTRLTNVTRALKVKDPDSALEAVAGAAPDWSGGTRIAPSLHAFNRDWSRRVLAQNPVVLLFTDGLERDADETLAAEMDRLARSCRRLVWLNPLLRFGAFEPRARGIKAMLPHVDDFRPVHNLASLESLVAALTADGPRRLPRAA